MSPNISPAGDDALSVIRSLGQQDSALELTKSFRGLVVRQGVTILAVNPDGVTLRVTDLEMCTALEGDVYLHNQSFPRPVMAHLESMNIHKGEFILSGFTYKDCEWKKRQHERVQPRLPTYVTLRWKGVAVRACLANISANGVGILAYKLIERGIALQPGANIHLDFQLSPDHKYTALKGTITHLNSTGNLATVGIRLFPKAKEAQQLERYVAHRKQEILEELSLAYWEKSKPRGVDSLYF
ncbi:MAG TPA: PilZ domain-containing protein [Anaerolineales bacterium]|nr:PilZ domain-containing protein [Anaerolineales bacterium]